MQTKQLYQSGVLACPDCQTNLTGPACDGCGRMLDAQDGTPSIFPTTPRSISFEMPPDWFNPGNIPEQEFFRFPNRHGLPGSGVYHLDHAHVDIIQGLPKDALFIEVGCGGGQMRDWVQTQGHRYIGTDVSKERVHDWLQQSGGADLLCDAHALPFQDAAADVIYSAAVWEHLAFPHLAAREAARVLKPGGYHLGSMSFLEPWHDSSYYHMTPYGVFQTLRLAGLRPLYIWPEKEWPAFKSVLEMGNKATRAIQFMGRVMNGFYLAPKIAQHVLRHKKWPAQDDLIRPRAIVAGAIKWIAVKDEAFGRSDGRMHHPGADTAEAIQDGPE